LSVLTHLNTYIARGHEIKLFEAEATSARGRGQRPRPMQVVTRPRSAFLASRPRPLQGLNIPGFKCINSAMHQQLESYPTNTQTHTGDRSHYSDH